MLGILVLIGALASALLAGFAIEVLRVRLKVEEALVAIPVETPKRRRWR